MLFSCVLIGIGGFVGAISRFFISSKIQGKLNSLFPYGTLTVNMIGCFLIGAVFSVLINSHILGAGGKHLIVTGFLGALTTFSTFSYETLVLIRDRNIIQALANVLIQVVAGIFLVYFGYLIMNLILR